MKTTKDFVYQYYLTSILDFAASSLIAILIFLSNQYYPSLVQATSINYGISQQPITDINQLMPKLCQNQSVICEGSFCIPGVRRCVCDLRMPVQFGRFCLKQVDIETKCFVTTQCNHTIKDAVCVDINSNAILDVESSMFKLEQWHQLNELRRMSQSALSNDVPKQTTTTLVPAERPMFLADNSLNHFSFEARDNVIMSNVRNSPYEINYTPELIQQNHTRRRTNHSDRMFDPLNFIPTSPSFSNEIQSDGRIVLNDSASTLEPVETTSTTVLRSTEVPAANETSASKNSLNDRNELSSLNYPSYTTTTILTTSTATVTTVGQNEPLKKKLIVKTPNWPPGLCLCPRGFMFDSMLRKCLALSLVDTHCQSDNDCKQISKTHCSSASKKCECDEPMVWNQTDLACVRPKQSVKPAEIQQTNQAKDGFFENLLPPLILAKLLPDQTMLLSIFVIMVIIGTLIILKLTVKCFSSSGSVLVSPKHQKIRKPATNNLPPRSPYATLKRPEHRPNSQLSDFTQATRGRILNYDFEQDSPITYDAGPSQSPQSAPAIQAEKDDHCSTMSKDGTLSKNKAHKHQSDINQVAKIPEHGDQLLELNDNVSISQLESESKSDNSILTIPGPPPNQPPPYMLASAMKGQGSAIAAAAAAVANRRMQMAQKKNLEQQASSRLANGSPVFL